MRSIAPLVSFCGVLVVSSFSAADADCLSRCLGSCSFYDPNNSSEAGRCSVQQGECAAQCAGAGSHNYGAIAYSQRTGAAGWSKKYDSRQDAENSALAECGTEAGDCAVVLWFDSACGAIAVNGSGAVSWGVGDTARAAQLSALDKCRAGGGQNCDMVQDACSRGDAD